MALFLSPSERGEECSCCRPCNRLQTHIVRPGIHLIRGGKVIRLLKPFRRDNGSLDSHALPSLSLFYSLPRPQIDPEPALLLVDTSHDYGVPRLNMLRRFNPDLYMVVHLPPPVVGAIAPDPGNFPSALAARQRPQGTLVLRGKETEDPP